MKKRKPAKPGKEYKCSNCTNVIKMEGMVDRKILCTKCNAGFFVLKKPDPRLREGNTMYEKSFGKWKQYRLSDGVKHPIIRYNVNIKKTPQKRGNEDPPW